jgi:hypothetical protein
MPEHRECGHDIPVENMWSRGEIAKVGDSRRINQGAIIASRMDEALDGDLERVDHRAHRNRGAPLGGRG